MIPEPPVVDEKDVPTHTAAIPIVEEPKDEAKKTDAPSQNDSDS